MLYNETNQLIDTLLSGSLSFEQSRKIVDGLLDRNPVVVAECMSDYVQDNVQAMPESVRKLLAAELNNAAIKANDKEQTA